MVSNLLFWAKTKVLERDPTTVGNLRDFVYIDQLVAMVWDEGLLIFQEYYKVRNRAHSLLSRNQSQMKLAFYIETLSSLMFEIKYSNATFRFPIDTVPWQNHFDMIFRFFSIYADSGNSQQYGRICQTKPLTPFQNLFNNPSCCEYASLPEGRVEGGH